MAAAARVRLITVHGVFCDDYVGVGVQAGGYRAGMNALCVAKRLQLGCWVGSMVGSALNSTAASHVLPLATHCDLDGQLLMKPEPGLHGGFTWVMDGSLPVGNVQLPDIPGVGVWQE
jgi:hypothetical protein